jgi:hypothetical protein
MTQVPAMALIASVLRAWNHLLLALFVAGLRERRRGSRLLVG